MYQLSLRKEAILNHCRYDWIYYVLMTIIVITAWEFVFYALADLGAASVSFSFVNLSAPDEEQMEPLIEQIKQQFPWALKVYTREYYTEPVEMQTDDLLAQIRLASEQMDPRSKMGLLIFDKKDFDMLMEEGLLLPLEDSIYEHIRHKLPFSHMVHMRKNKDTGYYSIYAVSLEDFSALSKVGLTKKWRRDKMIGISSNTRNIKDTTKVLLWLASQK